MFRSTAASPVLLSFGTGVWRCVLAPQYTSILVITTDKTTHSYVSGMLYNQSQGRRYVASSQHKYFDQKKAASTSLLLVYPPHAVRRLRTGRDEHLRTPLVGLVLVELPGRVVARA
ncbi:hypothetical protein PF002_g33402 [Phytophthora fragariae]|uniref:Secreted protein n=1 Tax=Phytophthora fragariae TaxID=53985 RepID=A0A6A3UXU4_9STRA|nr:hypothetical protein PF006_g33324 [Phytophthora fragariae]KAE9157292.1 hypothetical protein PF002_g33402 [Phytophthora fragariae]